EVSHWEAMDAPTEEELYWVYRTNGLEAARQAVTTSRSKATSGSLFREDALLTISKELSYLGMDKESADFFRLVAFTFPESVTAQLAAAQGLANAGNAVEARKLFEHVLKLDSSNQLAKEALSKTTN
ncbi:MAG: hypothetical protein ACRD2L_11090, partial [Terriglobia bacterium]